MANPGEWLNLKPCDGSVIIAHDENVLLGDISGMAKCKNHKIGVDNAFTSKGVNVGSGHVKYDGAGLVNGDLTEKMSIEATGDVTIYGIVEPASIKIGVDISITLQAKGNAKDSKTAYKTTQVAKYIINVHH